MSDPVTRLNAALEGRYAIERELGEGGMATVYLADDLKHERIANLGWPDIKLTAPVFHGDTVYAESEVLDKRESKSRPSQGIGSSPDLCVKAEEAPRLRLGCLGDLLFLEE